MTRGNQKKKNASNAEKWRLTNRAKEKASELKQQKARIQKQLLVAETIKDTGPPLMF